MRRQVSNGWLSGWCIDACGCSTQHHAGRGGVAPRCASYYAAIACTPVPSPIFAPCPSNATPHRRLPHTPTSTHTRRAGQTKRISLKHTRAIIDAIHSGYLDTCEYTTTPIFGLQVRATWGGRACGDLR